MKSWEQMQQLCSDQITRLINEVFFIPRSRHGQIYIVNGLQSSLHFSLGPIGKDTLHNFLHHHGIKVTAGALSQCDNAYPPPFGLFVKTTVQNRKTKIEKEYFKLMVKMGSYLWQPLVMVSQ